MAFAVKRRNSKVWTIYYYDRRTGKQHALPRKEHPPQPPADCSPEEANVWARAWEASTDHKVHRAMRHRLREDDELRLLWNQFQGWWQKMRNVSEEQIRERDNDFEKFVLPYFVGEHALKNVRRWHEHMLGYAVWLTSSTGLKNMVAIKSVLWMVRRFGEYLVTARVMQYPWVVMLPTRNARAATPLRVTLLPDGAMNAASTLIERELPLEALALLLGYFASLGPAEVYGLMKQDFMTGDLARKAAKTHEGLAKEGLGSGLSISIERQVGDGGLEKLPKNDYRHAVVNVWDVAAARMIAELLKPLPEGRLFDAAKSTLERHHRKLIKPLVGTTAHDLRRASALYLGRRKRIPLELLQRHLRHSELKTTELYIREPKTPDEKRDTKQNFDDVG